MRAVRNTRVQSGGLKTGKPDGVGRSRAESDGVEPSRAKSAKVGQGLPPRRCVCLGQPRRHPARQFRNSLRRAGAQSAMGVAPGDRSAKRALASLRLAGTGPPLWPLVGRRARVQHNPKLHSPALCQASCSNQTRVLRHSMPQMMQNSHLECLPWALAQSSKPVPPQLTKNLASSWFDQKSRIIAVHRMSHCAARGTLFLVGKVGSMIVAAAFPTAAAVLSMAGKLVEVACD